MKNKLFARIAPPDYIDMETYFDFKEEAAQGYVTVIHDDSRRYSGYKSPEWNYIEEVIDRVSYYLDNLVSYESPAYYKRFSDVLDDYLPGWENGKKRSGTLIHKWKEAVRAYDENGLEDETACELLELYTGKKWDYAGISGSCQGDSATVYFPHIENETERKRWIDALSAYYFGSGCEVEIHDGENEPEDADEISGYWDYIPIPYPTETEIKNYLSEQTGIEPENIVLYVPTSSRTVTSWSYEIA